MTSSASECYFLILIQIDDVIILIIINDHWNKRGLKSECIWNIDVIWDTPDDVSSENCLK